MDAYSSRGAYCKKVPLTRDTFRFRLLKSKEISLIKVYIFDVVVFMIIFANHNIPSGQNRQKNGLYECIFDNTAQYFEC